jgi:hypothetical protein
MLNIPSKVTILVQENHLELDYSFVPTSKVKLIRLVGTGKRAKKEEMPSITLKYYRGFDEKLGVETKKIFASPPEIKNLSKGYN